MAIRIQMINFHILGGREFVFPSRIIVVTVIKRSIGGYGYAK